MRHLLILLIISALSSCKESITSIEVSKLEPEIPDFGIVDTFEIFKYGPDSTYSRKIQVEESVVYLANSDGRIYVYNLTDSSTNRTEDLHLSELRDLHLTPNHILALQSGNGFKILKTDKNFNLTNQYIIDRFGSDTSFMDGFSFTKFNGVVMGDPEDDIFQIYITRLDNEIWKKYPTDIKAFDGEAGYAASGSNIQMINDSLFYWVSGGSHNRFFKCNFDGKYMISQLPIITGEGAGPFSMYFSDSKNGVVVGGDYVNSEKRDSISAFTSDAGNNWKVSTTPPKGYRSSVVGTKDGDLLVCSGRNGIDFSRDGGDNWVPFSTQPLFSLTIHESYVYGTMKSGQFCRFPIKLLK